MSNSKNGILMGIRDEELKRLKKYAEGLGLKVTFKPYVKYSLDSAAWAIDGSEIVIYENSSKSKTDIILDFVHELGHHVSFIYNNKQFPKKADNALEKELKKISLDRNDRIALLEWELLGMKYHDLIIKEVDIKIPKWKFVLENKLQEFVYRYIVKYGKSPKKSIRKTKYKELKEKYANKRSNK